MMKDAQSGKWPKCNCEPSVRPPPGKVIGATMLGGAGLGAVGGGLAGMAAGAAHAGTGPVAGMVVAEATFGGMVAGAVLLAAGSVVAAGGVLAYLYMSDPFCACDPRKNEGQICK
jgi:hypothetical protein